MIGQGDAESSYILLLWLSMLAALVILGVVCYALWRAGNRSR